MSINPIELTMSNALHIFALLTLIFLTSCVVLTKVVVFPVSPDLELLSVKIVSVFL